MIDKDEKNPKREAEELKEILSTVTTEVPTLIKSILASVFSEEAGKNMGKAAAAYYKELKDGGLPENVAVKLTEDYMRTFTSLGDMIKGMGGGRGGSARDISEAVTEAIEKKRHEREKDEDE
jgi:hypothetical protein